MGGLILIMSCEFSSRHDMWSSRYQCNYIEPPVIGNKRLTRSMFDHLWSCVRFSRHQHPITEGMSMKDWKFQLINEHIKNLNKHIMERISPSERLCVDEIFRIWYGLGCDWTNISMSRYGQMYQKPDSGCKIQDTCCGRCILMQSLKLVMGKT